MLDFFPTHRLADNSNSLAVFTQVYSAFKSWQNTAPRLVVTDGRVVLVHDIVSQGLVCRLLRTRF
jgi:hypothetical protein